MSGSYALVGDIGGTNARFAVVTLGEGRSSIVCARNVLCRDHASLAEAAEAFMASVTLTARPEAAVIAVAGPVANGAARLTNVAWEASEAELLGQGFARARLVNDFEALATGVADLRPEDSQVIGRELPGLAGAPILVAGAGTGFGLAALIRGGQGGFQVVASEGGHASFAPTDDIEIEILRALRTQHGRVSIERLLSGPGLLALYEIMAEILALPAEPGLTPEDITEGALIKRDRLCVAVLEQFCAVFGSVAGDAALTFGARGGVFLAGGLATGVASFLEFSRFRQRFEAKGRLSGLVQDMPTRVIVQPHTALIGAARIAQDLTARALQVAH